MSISRTGTILSRATLAIIATGLLSATMILPARAQVPIPTVTGPIPALQPPGTDPAHNYPQLASGPNFDLSRVGYIEEEFFFEGTATRYSTPSMADGVVLSSGHPYKSRVIVRRPTSAHKFNGVVIVEWVNVTSGYNLDLHWQTSRDYLTREGYAYVGVSAQRVGVQQAPYGLTAWSHKVYDGFVPNVGGGPYRTDVGTKQIRVNTENEIVNGQASNRQPDSDVFRSWELAGASHVGYWFMNYRAQLVGRDNLNPFIFTCNRPPLSHVNTKYVLNAAYDHLVNWIRHSHKHKDNAPPIAQPIQVTSTSPLVIPRDANGHVFGGIRLAAVDVPTATNTGANGGPAFCILYGSHEPFAPGKLAALYPSHRTYTSMVKRVTKQNQEDGFVLEDDADEIINDAEVSLVGTSHPLPIP